MPLVAHLIKRLHDRVTGVRCVANFQLDDELLDPSLHYPREEHGLELAPLHAQQGTKHLNHLLYAARTENNNKHQPLEHEHHSLTQQNLLYNIGRDARHKKRPNTKNGGDDITHELSTCLSQESEQRSHMTHELSICLFPRNPNNVHDRTPMPYLAQMLLTSVSLIAATSPCSFSSISNSMLDMCSTEARTCHT